MSLRDKLQEDMKTAMKSGDKLSLGVIRMLMSEMKYVQAAVDVHKPLTAEQEVKVVGDYCKKMKKSLEQYPEGEQADNIKREIAIIEKYLPKQATDDEVGRFIDKALSDSTDRNFGKIMKDVMAMIGPGADGKQVSRLVKEKLGS
jgi:uncharacterized protein YqeY